MHKYVFLQSNKINGRSRCWPWIGRQSGSLIMMVLLLLTYLIEQQLGTSVISAKYVTQRCYGGLDHHFHDGAYAFLLCSC